MRPLRGAMARVGALSRPASAGGWRHRTAWPILAQWYVSARRLFEEEAARFDRVILVPLGLAIGILAYFAAPEEPTLLAPASASIVLAIVFGVTRQRPVASALALLLAAAAAGITAGALRSAMVDAAPLERAASGQLEGVVRSLDARARGGARLVIRPVAMEGVAAEALPQRVRITIADARGIEAGATVGLRVALRAPQGPAYPGGFDFARAAFFDGVAASGYAFGRAVILPPVASPPRERVAAWLDRQRNALTARITAAIPGENGAVAASQVTGKRGLIPEEANDILRAAGLYHVVSISGLHMALFAGGLFAIIRAALALSSRLTLSMPLKTIAAVTSLLPAAAYTAFSGAEVATVRAFLMTAIALLAVALHRSALTRRNLALAAAALLVVAPDELVGPSFQMSFAAVGLLVAWADTPALRRVGAVVPGDGLLSWLGRATLLLTATTIVASLATAPFAAYHFHRLTVQSLAANLLAAPIISGLIMPSALLALVAEPFGYGEPAWALMGIAVSWFMAVARMVAAWPGAEIAVPQLPTAALACFVAALLGLTILRTRLAFSTTLPVAAGLAIAAAAEPPVALIGDGGRAALVRGADGLTLIGGNGKDFVVRQWIAAMGRTSAPDDPALAEHRWCDSEGCSAPLPDGRRLFVDTTANAVAEDCARVAVLVSPLPVPARCGETSLAIGRAELDAAGSVALRSDAASLYGLRLEPSTTGATRPWSQPPRTGPARPAIATEPLGFEDQ